MSARKQPEPRGSYVIAIERTEGTANDLLPLAQYLSQVGVFGCDVIIVDGSPRAQFDENRCVLRWVGRHIAARRGHRHPSGIDPVAAAIECAAHEKVIVADHTVRYSEGCIEQLCKLLDQHEVVVPQNYLDPLSWWGAIEAGRILVHRGIEPSGDGGTFGFRRSAIRALRSIDSHLDTAEEPLLRLENQGAELYAAGDVFVRREPPTLHDWLRDLPREAGAELAMPARGAFFFALIPMCLLLAMTGGIGIAGSFTIGIALCALALALRGRAGAGDFFPLRACLCAPLWVLERSFCVYWALLRKLRPGVAQATAAEELVHAGPNADSAGRSARDKLRAT